MAGSYFSRTVTAQMYWKEIPLPGPTSQLILFASDAAVEVQLKTKRAGWGDSIFPYMLGPLYLFIEATAVRVRTTSGSGTFTIIAVY